MGLDIREVLVAAIMSFVLKGHKGRDKVPQSVGFQPLTKCIYPCLAAFFFVLPF